MDNIVSQQIPHDSDAEKAVLGAIFIDPAAIADANGVVMPEDFYERANQIVFQAMLDLSDRNEAIDPVTLKDELTKKNQLEDIGGISYISQLAMATPTAAHVTYYAQIVHRKALLRGLISASQKIIQNAMQGQDDVTEILDDAESEIMNVSSENNSSGFRSIKDIMSSTVQEINTLSDEDKQVTGLATGFTELDKMTTGFHDDELIIVAARPGVGKTSFALNLAQHVGLHDDKSVAMFSLEMSGEQLVQRMLASEGLIDSQHLRTGQLDEEEWQRLSLAASTCLWISSLTSRGCLTFFRSRCGILLSEDTTQTVPTPKIRWPRLIFNCRSRTRYSSTSSALRFKNPLSQNSRSDRKSTRLNSSHS